ncbi:MAG: putative mitochondrial protein, conserved [Lichina confinis]|nr:MAG: putative mitochondrial protein, conserved [Lichina confinis]
MSLCRTSALRPRFTTGGGHQYRSWSSFGRLREDERSASALRRQPAPPRLPKEEQEIFERLQRSSFARAAGSSPPATAREPDQASTKVASSSSSSKSLSENAPKIEDDQPLHPDARRGAKPEFEGDVNPGTGEVGGPKNDPLRWGSTGEWTYNGRATDF